MLRQNNLGMVERRAAVIEADTKGEGLQEALNELANYVFKHMNTDVDNLQLVNLYEQARLKAVKESQDNVDSSLLAKAQAACDRPEISLRERAKCAADYLLKHGSGGNSTVANLPRVSDYTYSFSSPIWSKDMAGVTLLLATIVSMSGILRFIIKEERLLFWRASSKK